MRHDQESFNFPVLFDVTKLHQWGGVAVDGSWVATQGKHKRGILGIGLIFELPRGEYHAKLLIESDGPRGNDVGRWELITTMSKTVQVRERILAELTSSNFNERVFSVKKGDGPITVRVFYSGVESVILLLS